MGIGSEIGLIIVLVLANGAFAMSEIALVSSRRALLEQRAESGSRGAAAALLLSGEPNLFLSTVQVGITFIGTFAGAFGGAVIAGELAAALTPLPYVGGYSEAAALVLVVAGIGYLSIVLGELVPKRIALSSPERVAALVARPMRMVSVIARPAVAILSASTNLALRLLSVKPEPAPLITGGEIRMMIAHGARAGILEPMEREMLEGVFRLADRRAVELMTPRTQAVWIDVDQPVEDILRVVRSSPSSCFPAVRGSPDRIAGFIETRELVGRDPAGLRVEEHLKPAIEVPEDFPVLRLIELFRDSKTPMALVVDEHGQAAGVVTVIDLLEAIVGDLPQAGEEYEPRVVARPDGSLLVDGRLPIAELGERLHLARLGPADKAYSTLGGFVMHEVGRVPSIGDSFLRLGYRFEVVDMDGFRVDRVLISEAPEPDEEG